MERCQLSWLNPLRESVYLAIYLSIIPGNALLTLDLIIINHFVTRLQPDNHLLELSLRDQVVSPVPDIKKLTNSPITLQILEHSGFRSLVSCLHLIRTVRLNGSKFDLNNLRKLTEVVVEVITLKCTAHRGKLDNQAKLLVFGEFNWRRQKDLDESIE